MIVKAKNHHVHDFGIIGRVQTPLKPTLFIFGDTRTPKTNQENMGTSWTNIIFANMRIKKIEKVESLRTVVCCFVFF